jgi:hypothetical protein
MFGKGRCISTSLFTIGFFSHVGLVRSQTVGEVSIKLSELPQSMVLPGSKGSNRVLTASVTGGPIRSVWLARDPTSPRVLMTKTGVSEFQANLDSSEVLNALRVDALESEFRVFAATDDGTIVESIPVAFRLRIVPGSLEFPWDEAKLTVYQRRSRELPGSKGSLHVRLGDITAGQVLVGVDGPSGEPLVEMISLTEGSDLRLALANAEYRLLLERLVNLPIGDDFATFVIVPAQRWERKRSDRLLETVERSNLTFVRNDQELTGEMFAALLRVKLEQSGKLQMSAEQFIETIATRSSTSDRPYLVKLPDGRTESTGNWLQKQLKEMAKNHPPEGQPTPD